jgi:hypothetical protein
MQQSGGATLKFFLSIPAVLVLICVMWFVLSDQWQKYWDRRVVELCKKEGGIQVFERAFIEGERYVDKDNIIRIPSKLDMAPGYKPPPFAAQPTDLFFIQSRTTPIFNGSPFVARDDISVIRTSDNKVLGKSALFARVGGDPEIFLKSRFRCPVDAGDTELINQIFYTNRKQELNK